MNLPAVISCVYVMLYISSYLFWFRIILFLTILFLSERHHN